MAAGTDVVKVSVRKEDRFYLIHIIFEIFNIWNHVVNARVIFTGKKYAHVDNDNFTFVFDGGHVFTNTKFTNTTDWNNTNGFVVGTSRFELRVSNLSTVIAIETGFINWDTDDVLSGLSVYILGKHALVMDHVATSSRDRKIDLTLFGFSAFGIFDSLWSFGFWGFFILGLIGSFICASIGIIAREIVFSL